MIIHPAPVFITAPLAWLFSFFWFALIAARIEESPAKIVWRWIYGVFVLYCLSQSMWHLLWVIPAAGGYGIVLVDINDTKWKKKYGRR